MTKKYLILALLMFILLVSSVFAESFWTHSVSIGIYLQGGGYPEGADNLSIPNEAHDEMLSWRQEGLFFMIWMSDVVSFAVSDTFFPGDGDYGYTYLTVPSLGSGLLVFSLDNFKTVGRTAPLEFDTNDTLHVRMFHVNEESDTFEWSLDTVLAAPPSGGTMTLNAVLLSDVVPEAPTLASPDDGIKLADKPASLVWNIPADDDGDLLDFKVELSSSESFSAPDFIYESWIDATDFSISLPAEPASGQCALNIPDTLSIDQGLWYWRVSTFDGTYSSMPSETRSFYVNAAPEAVTALLPTDMAEFTDVPLIFAWLPPADLDGDSLWFEFAIDSDTDFGSSEYVYQSWVSADGFGPAVPVLPESDTVEYEFAEALPLEGEWYWRVLAYDGIEYGPASDIRSFWVNVIPNAPVLSDPSDDTLCHDLPAEYTWLVPDDGDGDDLHFVIEFAQDSTFSLVDYSYESQIDGDLFTPAMPVASTVESVLFTPPIDIGITTGTWYWRVASYDALEYSEFSAVHSFEINAPPAIAALNLPAADVSLDEAPASFQWTIPADSDADDLYFRLEIDSDGDFESVDYTYESWLDDSNFDPEQPVAHSSGNCTFIVPVDLDISSGHWYWRVNTYDGVNFSGTSGARHFSVNTYPTVPTLSSPSDLAVFADAPTELEWNVPADEDGDSLHFKVEISSSADFSPVDHSFTSWEDATGFSPVPPVGPASGTAGLTHGLDLVPGTYYWRVFAYDGSALSPSSSSWSFTIDDAPEAPVLNAPEADVLLSASPEEFSWSIPSDSDGDALHFIIDIDGDGDFVSGIDYSYDSRTSGANFSPSVPVASGSGLCTFTCPVGLTLSTGHWYWRVRAWDGYKYSVYTSTDHFAINAFPDNPTLVAPAGGIKLAAAPTEYSWNIPEDEDSDLLYFRVQIDSDGDFATSIDYEILSWEDGTGFSPVQPVASASGVCEYVPGSAIHLAPGLWYWRVSAYDGTDHSAFSATETFQINNPPEPPVATFPAADDIINDCPMKLTWSTPADLDADSVEFIVEINSESDFLTSIDYSYSSRLDPGLFSPAGKMASSGGTCNFILPDSLTLGEGHWFWRVKAMDALNIGNPSTAMHFEIDTSSAVSTIEYPADSSVFGTLDAIEVYGRAYYTIADVDSVEISFDGGSTWNKVAATSAGRHSNWSYSWTPPGDGYYTVITKAICAAEGVRESDFEYGRNEIVIQINTAAEGPIIDLSPAVLIYDYSRGEGGGFERALVGGSPFETHHDFEIVGNDVLVELSYPGPNFHNSADGYWTPEINGLENFGHPGEPLLPFDELSILLPQGKMIDRITVVDSELKAIPGNYTMDYGKTPYPNSFTGQIVKDRPDEEIYTSEIPYPASVIKNYDTQFSHGYSIAKINISPIVWTPSTNSVKYYSHMQLRIELKDITGDDIASCRGLENDRGRIMRKVENPEFTYSYTTEHVKPISILSCPSESSFTYVVIAPEIFETAYNPLIDWKKNRGISAKFVSTESILAEYSGVDNQEKIRTFILDAYNNWETEYVLLGADDEHIPHRGMVGLVYLLYYDPNIPSDMYYGCLDGNFNFDDDGYWGELDDGVSGGDIDWEAEVIIGRNPADNATDVTYFVDKVIEYESDPFASYKETASYFGEYLWNSPCGDMYGSYGLDLIIPYTPDGYTIHTFYESSGSWSGSSVKSEMNAGSHFLNHLGHSNYNYALKLDNTAVAGLANTDLFMVYSQGCFTAAYDDLTSGINGAVSENLVNQERGAFAYIGNTRYGWGYPCNNNGPSNKFHLKLTDAIFGGDIRHIGDALQYSREINSGLLGFYGAHRWVAYNLCLLGDPETPYASPGGSKIITIRNSGDTTLTVTDIQGRSSQVSAFPGKFTIEPGGVQQVYVTIVSDNKEEGFYADSLIFLSNDPETPAAVMPIQINIFGAPYVTGEVPPAATLMDISSHSVTRGDSSTISFEGDGADPDGYITGFNWLGALPETLATEEATSGYSTSFFATGSSFDIDADSLAAGMYSVMFTIRDNDGNWSIPMVDSFKIEEFTIVKDIDTRPESYAITDIYPNPFNSSVTVEYSLSEIQKVELAIYGTDGRHVRTIVNKVEAPGRHTVNWNAPQNVPSGTYLIRLTSKGSVLSQKVVLIK